MNPPSVTAGTAADAWDVLDRLVDDVAQLSRSGVAHDAFHHELLRRAVDALAAIGGVAWEVQPDGFARRALYLAMGPSAAVAQRATEAPPEPAHRQVLEWVVRRGEPLEAAPHAVVDPAANIVNPYEAALLLAPIVVDHTTIGVLELVHRPDVGIDARQGALRLLCALADCAADYQRERQRHLWQDRAATAIEFERLATTLYAELDSSAVAFAAANEGRRWAECDRVSVVLCEGTVARTLAVNGVDAVDRRSDQLRLLERLVAAVVRQGEPLWHGDRKLDVATPPVAEALQSYVDQSDATAVVVLPFCEPNTSAQSTPTDAPKPPLGAIVFEQFAGQGEFDDARRARLDTLCLHAGQALRRAVECESIPFGRWWRRQYRTRTDKARKLLRLGVYAMLVGLAACVPFLIPAEATVEARGSLEPEQRRDLFAPTDGIVVEVAVRHGQTVPADAPLIVLRKPELTVELTRVAGELQTAERRLTALRAARTGDNPTDTAARIQAQERSAEEAQLKETVRALGDEQRLLLEQARELTIRAPFAGTVTTWDVERILLGRPVARGQSLLGLADAAGPWVVELHVPDRLIGAVAAARSSQSEPLEVEFVTATHPERIYRGKLLHVAEATETDAELGSVVRATAAFDRSVLDATQLRPGAAVTARILCGPSSLGAVYTRDVRRFVRSLWW